VKGIKRAINIAGIYTYLAGPSRRYTACGSKDAEKRVVFEFFFMTLLT